MSEKHVSTLVINPSGDQSSGNSQVSTTSSFSSSMSSSKSVSSSKSQSSTSSKTVSSSTTVRKSSSTSVVKSSMKSSSLMSSSSSNIAIKSSSDTFGDLMSKDFGIDMGSEMKKLRAKMDQHVERARAEMFSLCSLEPSSKGSELVKLDNSSITDFIDKAHDDRLRFNFDVDEMESESISVKAVGNKIEVHGVKKSRKGDDETSEEFSRSYELPSEDAIDSSSVKSSFFKDGILTVELPYNAKAIEAK